MFAHTPPPFHGQSYMVKLMVDGLGGQHHKGVASSQLEIIHVNARFSDDAADIGAVRVGKFFSLICYCLSAIRWRFSAGARVFYYVPAPGKRSAVARDWLVMALCRPWFPRLVLHWHSVGLGEWIEQRTWWEQSLTRAALGNADLSIVLSEFNRGDAARLSPHRIAVVANGIPDPCADFDVDLLPERVRRFAALNASFGDRAITDGNARSVFNVLFLGACTESKGLFATLDAVAILHRVIVDAQYPIAIRLTVGGPFPVAHERERFDEQTRSSALANRETGNSVVVYAGFVADRTKDRLLRESDCLCFPTRYPHEGQPVTIIESLAYGLPVIATRWRGIPEMLEGSGGRLVEGQDPQQIAGSVMELLRQPFDPRSRAVFLERFHIAQHMKNLRSAIESVGGAGE